MDFVEAVRKLEERFIYFEVCHKKSTLSFYTDVNGEKTQLWVIDKNDIALNEFVVDNNFHIEELVEEFADQPMLADVDALDNMPPDDFDYDEVVRSHQASEDFDEYYSRETISHSRHIGGCI